MKVFTEQAPSWRYTEACPLNTKVLLLTHGGICVVGVWKGPPIPERNKNFRAWAGLPARERQVEESLGYI